MHPVDPGVVGGDGVGNGGASRFWIRIKKKGIIKNLFFVALVVFSCAEFAFSLPTNLPQKLFRAPLSLGSSFFAGMCANFVALFVIFLFKDSGRKYSAEEIVRVFVLTGLIIAKFSMAIWCYLDPNAKPVDLSPVTVVLDTAFYVIDYLVFFENSMIVLLNEKQWLADACDMLIDDQETLIKQREALIKEREALINQIIALIEERKELKTALNVLVEGLDTCKTELSDVKKLVNDLVRVTGDMCEMKKLLLEKNNNLRASEIRMKTELEAKGKALKNSESIASTVAGSVANLEEKWSLSHENLVKLKSLVGGLESLDKVSTLERKLKILEVKYRLMELNSKGLSIPWKSLEKYAQQMINEKLKVD